MRKFYIACLLVVSAAFAFTQSQPAAPEQPPQPVPVVAAVPAPADLQEIVTKQFGPNFKVASQRQATTHYLHEPADRPQWNSLMTGDLDGDGVEDAVIVARAKNAFGGQIPFGYRVIDPYFSAFGYGNPMITGGMAEEHPDGNYMVLVIHGAGPEGWRNPKPKAKFVMINLPFNTINVATINVEKKKNKPPKEETAIVLEEDGSAQSSIVVWTGRAYKWKDMGGPAE
jgi:hypothetical protein